MEVGICVSKWLDGGGQIGRLLAKGVRISKQLNGSILIISTWRDRCILVNEQVAVGGHIS